ncbi:MAG TPA: hypothetical protein VH249_09340 [Xanthobacteraceae bacterium]|jgi:hypothetical protein|nr:hypothetical protein [Xanthobacteraceae bacterium]
MRKVTIVTATMLVMGAAVFIGGRFGATNASEQHRASVSSTMDLMSGAKNLPVQAFDAF